MSKHEKCTCKACKNTVFHCQICKFVGFLLPSSSWLLKLPIISHLKPDLKDVRAHCYCASLQRTQIHMPRHQLSARAKCRKWRMIGKMAIVIALLEFSDLGCSVTPTCLFRNRFYLQVSPHYPKMNKKSMWEVKKNSSFLSSGRKILPSCGCKAQETMVAKCELVL